MPKYGTFRYGHIGKYGRYDLGTTHGKAIGEYVRYRMKFHGANGESEYLTMFQERVSIPSDTIINRARIRAANNEWVYMQSDTINADTSKVRIRSIGGGGELSQWVYGDKGNLRLI